MEWNRGDFCVRDDWEQISVEKVVALLSDAYWAQGRSKEDIGKAIKNALSFGVYHKEEQIGFARVVTDGVFHSWICDVIIHGDYRGKGLGKWLMACIIEHPQIRHTKQWLVTKDAHGLYEKCGFEKRESMVRIPK